jgi:hypothetical protein
MKLQERLAEIVRLDNLVSELVRSKNVLTLSDLGEVRRLKAERKYHVTALQSAGKEHRS